MNQQEILVTNINSELADILALLANYYTMAGDTYRGTAFLNASNTVTQVPYTITSGKQIQKDFKGVGKSSAEIIDEYITTGKVTRLEELQDQFAEQRRVIDYFSSFYAIGPITAVNFYNQGFRTLEDLWTRGKLSTAQRTGILWHLHFDIRIERPEMEIIDYKINSLLLPYNIKWTIAGSYRRGEPTSGDVDVLVESQPNINMDRVIELLQPIIIATLAHGPCMYRGILRLTPEYNAHRIDVRLIDPESYGAALMYFTGSQKFNILMRNRAITLGYSLSEYGLVGQKQLYTPTESDIFTILGVKYLTPQERTRTLDILTLL